MATQKSNNLMAQEEAAKSIYNQAGQAGRPLNDIERLTRENENLKMLNQDQATELLNLYRRVLQVEPISRY